MLRAAGYEAYGVDIVWPGVHPYCYLYALGFGGGELRTYDEGGRLPFDDDMFDVVVSNQVFEHVVPIERSVEEIERVLKPGGVHYHHFPSRTVLREGHIEVLLAHRPPGRPCSGCSTRPRCAGWGVGSAGTSGRHASGPRRSWPWVDAVDGLPAA